MNTELTVVDSGLSFSQALEALKEDRLISRAGWNGKGMFLFQRPEDTLAAHFISKVTSLPDRAKDYLINENRDIKFLAYICMFSAQGEVVNGWLASQTDMLSNDWCIVK